MVKETKNKVSVSKGLVGSEPLKNFKTSSKTCFDQINKKTSRVSYAEDMVEISDILGVNKELNKYQSSCLLVSFT